MNINRFFPVWLNVIVAGGAVGLAYDLYQAHSAWAGTSIGFAAGFGLIAVVRLFDTFD